jgi:hypothetical protein
MKQQKTIRNTQIHHFVSLRKPKASREVEVFDAQALRKGDAFYIVAKLQNSIEHHSPSAPPEKAIITILFSLTPNKNKVGFPRKSRQRF